MHRVAPRPPSPRGRQGEGICLWVARREVLCRPIRLGRITTEAKGHGAFPLPRGETDGTGPKRDRGLTPDRNPCIRLKNKGPMGCPHRRSKGQSGRCSDRGAPACRHEVPWAAASAHLFRPASQSPILIMAFGRASRVEDRVNVHVEEGGSRDGGDEAKAPGPGAEDNGLVPWRWEGRSRCPRGA